VSYDLSVFAFDRPDLASAVDSVRSPQMRVDGDPAAERGACVALARVTKRDEQHLCSIDGPLLAEAEDVPDEVASALLGCHWTFQISMASSLPARAVKIVDEIARKLAESGQGVVYDPQADQIVWPSNLKKLREVRAQERSEHAGRLELEWLWTRRLTSKDARSVLDIFRRDLPEAVPVRFGTYEPMQGRLERDGEDAFAELWDGVHSPFWKGTRPFDYGYVCLRRGWGSALSAEERDAMRPLLGGEKAPEVDAVKLQFRTEVIDDPRWLGAIRSLFERVCDEYSPFFAAAYLSPDRNAEMVALCGRWWLGVPSADFWLLYVGQVYELFLPPAAPGAASTGHGVLVTLAGKPDDWATISERRIRWPREVVRTGDHLDEDRAAVVIPRLAPGDA
jgi:hypothetical protein